MLPGLLLSAVMWLTLGPAALAQSLKAPTMHAKGTFEVKTAPVASDSARGTPLGRFSLDKQYHGDLEGTGKGEMLTAGDPTTGSAGYVAIERVTATLGGRRGSFALQHSGSMNHGALSLSVTVVPGSSTEQLAGITGTMIITITGGQHFYDLEYTLQEKP